MLLTSALMFSKDISVQLVLGCWFFLHIGQLFHFSFLVSSFWILYSHLLQPSSYRIHPSRGHSSLLWWVHSTFLLLMGMWASWFMTHLMKYSISLTNAKKNTQGSQRMPGIGTCWKDILHHQRKIWEQTASWTWVSCMPLLKVTATTVRGWK